MAALGFRSVVVLVFLSFSFTTLGKPIEAMSLTPKMTCLVDKFDFYLSKKEQYKQGHEIVVISRKKAADTGSLLTHFILF